MASLSVEQYVEAVPAQARPTFDQLRMLAKQELPEFYETVSYGVVGYKKDPEKRAEVFISGWKDHVALYPIPKSEALREELAPYIRGKGTLWFPLSEPLPTELIVQAIHALVS